MIVCNRKQLALVVAMVVWGGASVVYARDLPPPPPGPFISEGGSVSTVRPEIAATEAQKAQTASIDTNQTQVTSTAPASVPASATQPAPVTIPTAEAISGVTAAPAVPAQAAPVPAAPAQPVESAKAPAAPVVPTAPAASSAPVAPHASLPPIPPPVPVGMNFTIIAVPMQDAQGHATVEYRAIPQFNPATAQH